MNGNPEPCPDAPTHRGDGPDTPAVSRYEGALLSEMGRRHGLWTPLDQPLLVSRGTENTTFTVGDYIVRLSDDFDAVRREVNVLDALARAAPVPTPVPELHEPALGLMAYRRLRGTPLLLRSARHPSTVVPALVAVLSALRRIPSASCLPVDHYPNEQWHSDAVRAFACVRSHLSVEQERRVGAFLDEAPPSTRAMHVAQHNDLGAEHILVDNRGEVTGIIDWTDAARTDPARDIGSVYRDLGPAAALRLGEALDGSVGADEMRRIRFHARCRWLEDVVFGMEAPLARRPYLVNAWSTFAHTFGSEP